MINQLYIHVLNSLAQLRTKPILPIIVTHNSPVYLAYSSYLMQQKPIYISHHQIINRHMLGTYSIIQTNLHIFANVEKQQMLT